MLKTVLFVYVLISVARAIAAFNIFDSTERSLSISLINLIAITYYNKDKLTKLGFVFAVLADFVLLPGALFGSILYFVANGISYFVNKFCIKQK